MSDSTDTLSSSTAPPRRPRRRLRTWQVVLVWFLAILPLTRWGLPTSHYDAYLFDQETTLEQQHALLDEVLTARSERGGGADTDLNPIGRQGRIVDLTATEADRAAILFRYRFFSRQPDEMITFMALQRMNPRAGDLDPRLYQYGGGYIYLVGAALGASSLAGLVTLTSAAGVYLRDPDLFARFYLVARVLTLIFGAGALIAVVRLGRRVGGRLAGWLAFAFVAVSPVFLCGVLEAKPHVPAVCMTLWAILFALDYHAKGRRRDAIGLGLCAGYAFGLVLTGLAAVLLWPAVWLARRHDLRRTTLHLLFAAALAIGVYVVTNPYVPYNLLFNRDAFSSNVDNSTAMYSVGALAGGAWRVTQLLIESAGPGLLFAGLVGLIWFAIRRPAQSAIVAIAGVGMLLLCIAIGAGKPAEFARFLLLPVVLLAVAAGGVLGRLSAHRTAWTVAATLVILALFRTPAYLHAFYVDAHYTHESRRLAAEFIQSDIPLDESIGVIQEPAPYAIPPLDFAHRTIRLLPPTGITRHEFLRLPTWLVLTADDPRQHADAWWQPHFELATSFAAEPHWLARITWANKSVFIYRRTNRIRPPDASADEREAADSAGGVEPDSAQ